MKSPAAPEESAITARLNHKKTTKGKPEQPRKNPELCSTSPAATHQGGKNGGLKFIERKTLARLIVTYPFANDYQVHRSGRAQRGVTAHAMQGWHVQCLIGYGEVGEPIIKDKNFNNNLKHEKVSKASVCSSASYFRLWFGYSLEAYSKTRSKNIASVVQGSFQLREQNFLICQMIQMWILTLSHSLLQGVASLEDETIRMLEHNQYPTD
ncbi:hypothetical protein LOK49_LG09G01314 [Camellia lanceoleosa]|uniref:Uncharacterized protein n=1 Tax=Camellia lanceoleosa TaxID=1840588 RepID=A0ACC0GI21_9ERIC|nr:hypothetical protein LOK49_LG09G01314 [Camellia lanceoleosa]